MADTTEDQEINQDQQSTELDPHLEAAKYEAEQKMAEAEKKYIKATYAFDMGDLDEALMLIRAALAICPGNAKYHYNIGFLYWRKDLIEVAVNHYKLFLRYAPADDKSIETISDRVKYLENEIKKRRQRR